MSATPHTTARTGTRRASPRAGRTGRILRAVGAVVLVGALGAAWLWQRGLPLRAVEVTGTVHADPAEIVRLTEARPDSDRVFALSPALIEDRAERAPWVRTANVRRLPSGVLSVRVEEREPVVLVMRGGRPSGFFDATGVALPLDADTAGVSYDVPLLSGNVPDVVLGEQTESAALRETLAALAGADDATDALVSEVEWHAGGRAILWTTPAGGQPSIPVRIGRGDVAGQLARLRAFWDQSVLPRPQTRFRSVDLRFDGQVVTEEGDPPARDSTATATARRITSPSTPPDAG